MKKHYPAFGIVLSALTGTLFVFCLLMSSCKDDEPVINDIGYGYFPTEIGHWVIYEVDSTVYDDFDHDTDYYRYQVKEVLHSVFTDNEGRQAVRVERYKRWYNDSVPYDSIPWYLARVWAFTRTNSAGEKLEENERFIRLAFPVREGSSWDGNAYNTIGPWTYRYKDVDVPYTIASFTFDSTARVEQKKEINLINHKYYSERYARNVGMIERNVIDVRDTGFSAAPVLNRIYAGVVCNITLVDYGPR